MEMKSTISISMCECDREFFYLTAEKYTMFSIFTS